MGNPDPIFDGIDSVLGDLTPLYKRVAVMAEAGVKDNIIRGESPDGNPYPPLAHPRPRGGKAPLRDRGLLLASIESAIHPDGVVEAGTNLEHAELLNSGGVIEPKQAKMLAIPATVEAQRVDSPRYYPGDLHFRSKSAGKGILVDDGGTTQYYLTDRVEVPPRPFAGLSEKWWENILRVVADFFGARVTKSDAG